MTFAKDRELPGARTGWLCWIGPGVVLLCLFLDISLRFFVSQNYAFRSWEVMRLSPTAQGPFTPNAWYRSAHAYGDLANLGNVPRLRQYRGEEFHSDSAGYRNPQVAVKPYRGILLMGDSFGGGSGLSDDKTLAPQIARLSRLPVYNVAPRADAMVVDELHMTCGLVIWQQSERVALPSGPVDGQPPPGLMKRVVLSLFGEHGNLLQKARYAPLRIWFSRAIRSIQDDRILPNPYRDFVELGVLRNGQEILFYTGEVEAFAMERQTDPAFFLQLQQWLAARGLGLLVLLVPDKYVVYHDLLLSHDATDSVRRPLFMDIVAQRLAAAQVPVVNLTGIFRQEAASHLVHGSYIYSMDDTHWNAEGVQIAASQIVASEAFRRMAGPCNADSSAR